MPESVRDRVIAGIASARHLAPEDVSLETTFESLGLNSLDVFSLIGDLEDELGIEIPNEEVMGIRSVGETITAVEKLVAERA
ncbi:MAG TPA: acyl carrier protein [Thermoanaerobaculia bacterium]|nr:acyl carrier protein [Thermoanaerobaculia bacterium]